MGRRRVVALTIAAAAVLLLVVGTGYVIGSAASNVSTVTRFANSVLGTKTTLAPGATPEAGTSGTSALGGAASSAAGPATSADSAVASGQGTSAGPLIVVNAGMDVRVKDVNKALDAIRAAAAAAGGTVTDLTVASGTGETPSPQPLDTSSAARSTGPSSATVTLRIPVAKLPDVQRRVTSLGDVVSQSSSESDVTQQHVDMAARLKNLQAEEVRLRDLLKRAGSVSDLLEVERELSRVRGEIESMQAQLAYLEKQAAMATLSITLAQPGALVRPPAATWGIADAFTLGVQSAAGVVRAFITGAIALSPVALLALLAWVVWRLATRRRRRANAIQQENQPDATS